jgi:hypothetical protein
MGNLSNYESNEVGSRRMATLRGHGASAKKIVQQMYSIAVEYNNYRAALDPVADAEDIAYSDGALSYMVAELKPILDNLSPEEKAWLDMVLSGLGFQPIVE